MTEIYLIRHAQAEGNRYRILQGHWDGDVTALGLRQIELLSARFARIRVDAVYSSDLRRARLTAGAITRRAGLPLRTDERLREINIGPWEARFFGNVTRAEPELARRFIYDQEHFFLEGAETYAQVGDRASAALREIAEGHRGQTVAVVSHGVTIRCMLSRLTGIPLHDVQALPICGNTGVTRLLWDGERFTRDYYGDLSHLAPLGEQDHSWSRCGDVWDEPFEPLSDPDFYRDCYADTWQASYGNLEDFHADTYLQAAQEHYRRDPESVLRLWVEERCIGLVDMNTRRELRRGCGWISLLYLKPGFRGQGYGIQALARAYLKYTRLGRTGVCLHAAGTNQRALAFYTKEGFTVRERLENGVLLLEKKLGGGDDG